MKSPRKILAFDSLSALIGGSLTLTLSPLMQSLHHWTPGFIHYIASVNLVYGLYSGSLWLLLRRFPSDRVVSLPRWPLLLLVTANGLWALQCLFQVWRLQSESTGFGIAHLLLESLYVGILAYVEAKVFRILRRA